MPPAGVGPEQHTLAGLQWLAGRRVAAEVLLGCRPVQRPAGPVAGDVGRERWAGLQAAACRQLSPVAAAVPHNLDNHINNNDTLTHQCLSTYNLTVLYKSVYYYYYYYYYHQISLNMLRITKSWMQRTLVWGQRYSMIDNGDVKETGES